MLNRDPGAPHFPTIPGHVAPSPLPALDLALTELQSRKHTWVTISVDDRIRILDRLITDYAGIMNRWVAANPDAGQMAGNRLIAVDEWENVYAVIRSLRVLRRALADVRVHGRPRIPGPVTTRPDGQVVARVFPYRWDDALILRGTTIEVWMQPDVTPANLPDSQAGAYRNKRQQGKVAVVLGAGNASSIAPLDVLNKLFVENQVVILKTNPVSSRWGPLIEEGFRALAEPGFIRVVYGGPNEGAYLCNHPGVDEIHVTGSDKTYDAIVFGGGSDASARKAAGQPMLTKPVTCELGNVSPVIVIPGPWGSADLAYAAEFLVATLTNNAGFNCDASRHRATISCPGRSYRSLIHGTRVTSVSPRRPFAASLLRRRSRQRASPNTSIGPWTLPTSICSARLRSLSSSIQGRSRIPSPPLRLTARLRICAMARWPSMSGEPRASQWASLPGALIQAIPWRTFSPGAESSITI